MQRRLTDHFRSACCVWSDLRRQSYCPVCQTTHSLRPCELMSGCHLNLCHLCAPSLLLRHRKVVETRDSPPPPTGGGVDSSEEDKALHWNRVLARATANHPKARRLSMGGFQQPTPGQLGSELCATSLLCSNTSDTGGNTKPSTGTSSSMDSDGRVRPVNNGDSSGGPRCLMCRTGVSGWLRVFPG